MTVADFKIFTKHVPDDYELEVKGEIMFLNSLEIDHKFKKVYLCQED